MLTQDNSKSINKSILSSSSCICISIICIFLIGWYWRIRIMSQAIGMGRPLLAASTFFSGI